MAGIGRDDRLPMVPVGDDETRIGARRTLALDLHAPALRRVLGARDALIEADQRIKPELLGVSAQIVLRLCPARIMRPLLREMKIRVARELLGGIQVGRAVDDVRALRIPDAADVGQRLETIEGNAALGKTLGHGQAAGTRADNAETLHRFVNPYAVLGRGAARPPLAADLSIPGMRVQPHRRASLVSLICVKSLARAARPVWDNAAA